MKLAAVFIVLLIAACAMLASHQRKPFGMRIDANPGPWPTNAAYYMPGAVMCRPMVIQSGPMPKPIVRT